MRRIQRASILCAIGICSILFCSCKGNDNSATEKLNESNESQMTEVNSSLKISDEQINEWKQELKNNVETLTFLTDDMNQLDSFADYLGKNYELQKLAEMTLNEEISKQFYAVTGKSLFVLWDDFTGKLCDSEIAEENGIYQKDSTNNEIQITFAGDICLTEDDFVVDHYDEQGDVLNSCIDQEIIDVTNQADIFMINHEFPVSNRGTALDGKYYTFRAKPEREEILKELGTDVVCLANNHIYDYGVDAFYDTLDILKQKHIPYVGAGCNIEEAAKPVYYIIDGMKIGFVSANRSEKIIYTPEAGENTPGVVRMYNTEMMNQIIQNASKECDYLIAYIHWGTENSPYYEVYQTDIAKEFIESGADAIIGGHPHVLQGMEYIDGKPVVYSLGDFWFNSETKYTTIVNLTVSMDGLKSMTMLPCIQKGFETHKLTDTSEIESFMDYMRSLSPNVSIDDAGVINQK